MIKKYSTYPGFVGFRIKEEKPLLYSEDIYREFLGKCVVLTGKQTDRVFRTILCDKFVDFVVEHYKLHPDTKGEQRFKIQFLNEFNTIFKKIYKVDYNQELKTSANKIHLHGGFECCKLI